MIKINNWEIDSDGAQYKLQYNTGKIDKKGNLIYKDTTYHPSVEMALNCLAKKKKMQIVQSEELELSEAIEKFKEVNAEMRKILKGAQG